MKSMKKYGFMAVLAALLLTGCYSEDPLKATEMEGLSSKFDFPQGTTEADAVFERIYEKFGTQVIYKDFTERDLLRSWTLPSGYAGGDLTYLYKYVTDPDKLLEAALTIEKKVFGLLPEDIMKEVLKPYPYLYLTDDLRLIMMGGRIDDPTMLYPVKALDGLGINLQLDAAPDDYTYKVFFPLRLAVEFFIQAFNKKLITMSPEFYAMKGSTTTSLRSYVRAMSDPLQYDNYWARQGYLQLISFDKGIPKDGLGKTGKAGDYQSNSAIPPLTEVDKEIPWFFIFLSTDRNWRTYDDVNAGPGDDGTLSGIFYDCPMLVNRLELYTAEMKRQGIDFEEIQRILYDDPTDNSTVVTNPWPIAATER